MTALSPSASPASAILRMSTLPSREVVESLTLPEHTTSTAPPGYVLKWLAALKAFSTSEDRPQNHLSLRNLQETQFSIISRPYGVFMVATTLLTSGSAGSLCEGGRTGPALEYAGA